MQVFYIVLGKIIPLYLLILLGFFAGRLLKVGKESIAALLIYLIVPGVVFTSIMNTELDLARMTLPVLFYFICCGFCLGFYALYSRIFRSPAKNILAYSAGTGNTGYFGLPLAVFLLGERAIGVVVLVAFGFIFYESTLGFFITARGHHSVRESLMRVFRLPSVYAFLFALALNGSGVRLSQGWIELGVSFRGAYSVLGMMMIGLGISDLAGWAQMKPDLKFVGMALLPRLVAWPVAMVGLVYLDRDFFHLFDELVHRVMILMSMVPMAANTVAFATVLRAEPQKSAVAVLWSTLFALAVIPAMSSLFF